MREGIEKLLAPVEAIQVVGSVGDMPSLLTAVECHHPDVVVTDIRMPRMNGFELYRKIKEKNPSMKIVFITAFEINKEEFSNVLPSIEVKDFIIKPISMTNLRIKLKEVLKGS